LVKGLGARLGCAGYSSSVVSSARQRRPLGMDRTVDTGGRKIMSPEAASNKLMFPQPPSGTMRREVARRTLAPHAGLDHLPDPESLLAALRGVGSEAARRNARRIDATLRRLTIGQGVSKEWEDEDGLLGHLAEKANISAA